MSRASKGFADFFPTAPSVLQSRKTKAAQDRHSGRNSAASSPRPSLSSPYVNGRKESASASPRSHDVKRSTTTYPKTNLGNSTHHDSNDHSSGDLLNGTGSASSDSTASSVFSTNHLHSGRGAAGVSTHALTPLTSVDSSPPQKFVSPSPVPTPIPTSTTENNNGTLPKCALTPLHSPPTPQIPARAIGLVVKGCKVTYDPELDKTKAHSKEKKKKAEYANFGTKPEDDVPPRDPRLSIAHYTKGAGGNQKSKFRPAPYVLKPWAYDAATSVGPGPPTQIIITGFDPLSPISQVTAVFATYGEIADVSNKTNPATGRILGICVIRYRDSRSFRGGEPVPAIFAAKRAFHDSQKGLRVGARSVRVHLDRDGSITKRFVDKAIETQQKETVLPVPEIRKEYRAPPTAPKGPKGPVTKPHLRPVPPPQSPQPPQPAEPVQAGPKQMPAQSHVEEKPVVESLKREPYVFIAHCYVPVLLTTIPHLKKRLRSFDWRQVRLDQTGYYVVFEDSKRGEEECLRCFHACHMEPLFTYVMNMECQQYGNPSYERSPTPEGGRLDRKTTDRLRREREADIEEEKKQRARDMDPARAVLELVVREIRDKLIEDVKSRVVAPSLYTYLDPDRHIAKRQKLGIEVSDRSSKPTLYSQDESTPPVGTPDAYNRAPLSQSNVNIHALPRISKKQGTERTPAGFADERRKRQPPKRIVRPLYHRLAQFHEDEESDEESQTPFGRDTEEQESRPMSRMSMTSVESTREEEEVVETKKEPTPLPQEPLLEKEEQQEPEAAEEPSEAVEEPVVEIKEPTPPPPPPPQPVVSKNAEMIRILRERIKNPKNSAKRRADYQAKLAILEAEEDEELFGLKPEAVKREPRDVQMEYVKPATEILKRQQIKIQVRKPKAKKPTKKEIFAEQTPSARESEQPEDVEMKDAEEEAKPEEPPAPPEPEINLEEGFSKGRPQQGIVEDDHLVLDIDGWQHIMQSDKDIQIVRKVLSTEAATIEEDVSGWVSIQKRIKALNINDSGITRQQSPIKGYYAENPAGCARAQPIKKILEAEKSKYLPHRIKVQRAREEREARAKRDPKAAAIEAAKLEAAKQIAKSSSRSNRVESRRMANTVNRELEMLGTHGNEDAVVAKFNQLKARKKPVRFARSAIHNWGLYAMENISANDMIIEYVGEKIRQEVADLREQQYLRSGIGSSYLFRIDEGTVIDATKKGGIARFINHSCTPNCTAKIIRVEHTKRIVIYALRDIERGTFSLSFVLSRPSPVLTLPCSRRGAHV